MANIVKSERFIKYYLQPCYIAAMQHPISLLALGDSYTIGEAVPENQRWPEHLKVLLAEKGIALEQIDIIATTGWTTDELLKAIEKRALTGKYSYVSLLIGVNNQYRGYNIEVYKAEFERLLNIAFSYALNKENVFVLSIPDWGVTPFAEGRDRQQIAKEIDAYNSINKHIALQYNISYIDVTGISRIDDDTLVADDKLHPSGKMYALWAEKVFQTIFYDKSK